MQSKGQQINQIGLSNYGMVHSLHLNPSMPAYGKYLWQVNLAGFWANVNNNYLSLHLPYSIYKVPNRIPAVYQTESGNPAFNEQWLLERMNGKSKHVSVSTDVYGPSASFRVHKWTFGIFTQASANIRATRLPESLAHALLKEFDSSKGAFTQFSQFDQNGLNVFNAFSISGNSRINLGINAAHSIKLAWGRQLLLGVSIKKVWGLPGFYFNSDGLNARAVTQDSIVFSKSKMQLITYGETMGRGWGSDIGATYVFHKKDFKRNGNYSKTRTNYFCKLGFSILDIGNIRYKNAQYNEVKIEDGTGMKINSAFRTNISNNPNYQAVTDSFMKQFGSYSQYQGGLNVGLPTRIVFSSDFQFNKNLYVAALLSQSLRKKMSEHARYQSFFMVSPRLEYRYFEISLPAILEYDYKSVRLAASIRIGPFFFGTNSLNSFINTRVIKDADVFAGIAFGNLSEFSFKKLAYRKKQKRAKTNQSCGVF